jgi:hydroxymethylbilane synthase
MRKIVFGIRQSRLARTQFEEFISFTAASGLKIDYEVEEIRSKGDRFKSSPIEELGQGIFIKELEERLIAKDIDCAVHSLKDMPVNLTHGTLLSSFCPRADERDCLVCRRGVEPYNLKGKRIAIGSPRRRAFMIEQEHDIDILPLRGNVDTRVKKLEEDEFDAMVLAACGLERIGYGSKISRHFKSDAFVPAAGQGVICSQTREDDRELNTALEKATCHDTARAANSERLVLKELGVGCRAPFGAFARFKEEDFLIDVKFYLQAKRECFYRKLRGPREHYLDITNNIIKEARPIFKNHEE